MDDKDFLTYEQQIDKLRSKNLEISAETQEHAMALLKEYSYFSLINGYKEPFKNKDSNYKKHTTIDDIYDLYVFDNELRLIFMRYILKVELHIKSLLSYSFCEKFGKEQAAYQNVLNYNYLNPYLQKEINDLVQILSSQIGNAYKFSYLEHLASNNKNIPLWVLIKTLSFGNVSKMYSLQQDTVKSKISKEFPDIDEKKLEIILDVLTRFRNVCAHNERLYNYTYKKARLKSTSAHRYFGIKNTGSGESNLFDVIIFLKYLLCKEDYFDFINGINTSISGLSVKTNQIQKEQILKLMHFPPNWMDISDI